MERFRLRYLREQQGMSQYELAPKLGLKRATYANYENGNTQPTIEVLIQIADYYGVSLDYLCDHKTENLIQFGYLDNNKRSLIAQIANLSDAETQKVSGYIKGLIDNRGN